MERDARIKCIEVSLISGIDASLALRERKNDGKKMVWDMTESEKHKAFIVNFTHNYQKSRRKSIFSFLKRNFVIEQLDIESDYKKKLSIIRQFNLRKPKGRVFKSLKKCIKDDPILYDIYKDNISLHDQFFPKAELNSNDGPKSAPRCQNEPK